ncbi:ABC transporter substrate-binding protein [Bosea sp. 2KB_26]|uniref:ABC transporter substrate-binding protein n=1 Tax=Bosea sp. 2KB_26 TaxID=3237475 RepID=UPI003F91B559
MTSRTFLSRIAFAAGMFALGALSQPAVAQDNDTFRFAAATDIRVIDPIWSLEYNTRNHGYLVYDTLFSYDSKFQIKPQMVDSWTVSDDKLEYKFKLRPGLTWHDGAPVTAADCVASIKRWGQRDSIGQALITVASEIKATGADTFEIMLKEPFGHVISALAKTGSPVPFMMPERIAKTSGFEQIKETIGSGPFMFARDEWVPGDKAVYKKFRGYKPRSEPSDFMSGGKVANVERMEWLFIPNGATAAASLMAGEVDWLEHPPSDLLPTLQKDKNIVVRAVDPYGMQTMLRFNHIHPPFDNEKVRRAVLQTIDQGEYLRVLSDDKRSWEQCRSFYFCGTKFGRDFAPGELLFKKNLDEAKKTLAESGYKGEKVVLLDAVDDAILHPITVVLFDNLKSIGMNVELRATDGATIFALMLKQEPITQGGWSIGPQYADSTNYSVPFLNNALRAGGVGKASIGWPKNDEIEALRAAFLKAPEAEQPAIADSMQKAAYAASLYGLTGQYKQLTAHRNNVEGLIDSPIPVFWNVRKK